MDVLIKKTGKAFWYLQTGNGRDVIIISWLGGKEHMILDCTVKIMYIFL